MTLHCRVAANRQWMPRFAACTVSWLRVCFALKFLSSKLLKLNSLRHENGYCFWVVKVRSAGVKPSELTIRLIVPGTRAD